MAMALMRCHGYVDLEEKDFFGKPNLYYTNRHISFSCFLPVRIEEGWLMKTKTRQLNCSYDYNPN